MESCLKIGKAKGDVQVTFWTLDDVMMCWCCFLGWEIWKMSGMYCLWWIDSDNHSEAKYRYTVVYKCRDAVDGMDLFEERVNFTPLHNSYLGNARNPISLLPKPTKWSSVIQIAINLRWLFRFQPSFKWQARACRKPTKDLLLGEKGCKGCLVSWFSAPVPKRNHYGRRNL